MLRWSWSSFIIVVASCGYTAPVAAIDASTGPDVFDPDAPPDGPDVVPADARACFGSYINVCLTTLPAAARTFDTDTGIDTGGGGVCADTGATAPGLCVIAATNFTISAGVTLRAIGSTKPIVLLATTGGITIAGTLDVSSKRGGNAGAGRASGACNAGTNPTGDGGGQGGSFGFTGGNGGDGNGAGNGVAGAITALPNGQLRGGCNGANGAGGTAGAGGNGGGAVLLIAVGAINVSGSINASGASGTGATQNADGAGGGGSGGAIVFDGASIAITGNGVFANGGGGGEGAGDANNGNPGTDPGVGTAGQGGSGGTVGGGDGGDGSSGATGQTGTNGNPDGGGGGGGGGGVIRSVTTPNGSTSPAVTPIP